MNLKRTKDKDFPDEIHYFKDRTSKYQMIYYPEAKHTPFVFLVPLVGEKNAVTLTARDIERYHPDLKEIIADPCISLQYLEVGVGLGEPITKLGDINNKPIAIDPANYEIMAEILTALKSEINSKYEHVRLEWLRRCEYMLSDKVRLIGTTLGEAVKMEKLWGIADVVVDNFGPTHWTETEGIIKDLRKVGISSKERIVSLELNFLKQGGKLYSNEFSKPYTKSHLKSQSQ